jgi:putative SOS response-associated peptidase YedK
VTFAWEGRYNVAPGQEAPVVAEDRQGRRMGLLCWGLVPSWADDPGRPFVNARAETAHRTRSFREAFARRRCLVPADGFYEWLRDQGGKRPFWLHPSGGGVLALAGIWERWDRPGRAARHGFAILTVDANEDVAPIHDRMPLVVLPSEWDPWLAADTPLDRLTRIVRPLRPGALQGHEVSTRVNTPAEDDAGLIEPV